MDSIFHAIVLAIVQGLTEFLPVSSSAHLILVPILLHWPDQGIAFDVATHLGTLIALFIYFRHELKLMIKDWFKSLTGKTSKNARLAWAVGFGTIPVGIAGIVFNGFITSHFRVAMVIGVTTIAFGLLLGLATLLAKQKRDEYTLTWRDVLIIGCAQAIALIPGTSRSGITLTAGLFVGLTRTAAARYSFLLSIPVIMCAGVTEGYRYFSTYQVYDYKPLLVGMIVAAISGYICIDIFLRLLQRYGVMPFVIYRLILGVILLALFS
ncbi:MAG TPA: undecaprenyl-diphosphate phosphatase [Gammaproteobacteria bacterium]|nr:undecaprenyl-diphosphate phosphatase [Gammaproteobacteria bacterium]